MIQEAYVSPEVAKLLKEKGFPQDYDIYHSMIYNEEDYEDEYEVQRMVTETRLVKAGTLSSYPVGVPDPKCYAPTHQMAMKWLREVHNILLFILPAQENGKLVYLVEIWTWNEEEGIYESTYAPMPRKEPEQAVEAAIKYALEKLI